MMIECDYNCGRLSDDHRLLVCRPTGILTGERAWDLFICQNCLKRLKLWDVNRFHDLMGITGVDLHFDRVSALAKKESEIRKNHRQIKACYLVPNDGLYGIVRMYQALAEENLVDVHVSHDIRELASVLNVDEQELMGN